jgi:hypothetical protein
MPSAPQMALGFFYNCKRVYFIIINTNSLAPQISHHFALQIYKIALRFQMSETLLT